VFPAVQWLNGREFDSYRRWDGWPSLGG